MKFVWLASALLATTTTEAIAVESDLWGQAGELWNSSGVLRNFTDVGYMSGNVAIPSEAEWPNNVSVLDFGAVPNDDQDDSQAFIDAINACADYSAVFVPAGKYIIRQQIRVERDNFVLRGADMYNTILYFPQYLGELYPAVYFDDSYGKGGFFHVDGGTQRSIENLAFEFRPQTKMGFWELRGANAIKYRGDVSDSWIRNIHFRNVDFGIQFDGADRVSVLNLYFDHFIGRPAFVDSSYYIRTAAYLGIGMGKLRDSLVHNVEYTGDMFHDFDIINVPSYTVVSKVKGPSVELRHHSLGAHHNLYTDIYCGVGFGAHGLDDTRMMHHETHWGIHRVDRNWPIHPAADFRNAMNSYHVFVGYAVDYNDTFTETFYYENIDPALLTPPNIYVAQMDYVGKPLPLGPPATPPLAPGLTGDVRLLNPTEDVKPGQDPQGISIPFDGYLKFDLTQLQDLSTIERATLKLSPKTRTTSTFNLAVASVADDQWTQDSLTTANEPAVGAILDSVFVDDDIKNKWWALDVTAFVQQEWTGDKIVSLFVGNDNPGNYLGGFHSRESGNSPLLVIERVADPVPGAPAAPTGMNTISENGHIVIDWEDNTEADFSYYNVYRSPAPNADHPVAQGLTISEYTDISATEDRGLSEMPSDTNYFYTVTAVDSHGYESVRSAEFVGNTLSASNSPPAFGATEYTLLEAETNVFYAESVAALATDPESDPLYYFKISGPSWLHVAYDGTITGTPQAVGTFQVLIQVNALGGRDQAVFNLTVVEGPPPVLSSSPSDAPSDAPSVSPSSVPSTVVDPCMAYSTKDCAQLGTGYRVDVSGRDDSLQVCGASKYDDGSCLPAAATWQDAMDTCQSVGARLCTKDEVVGWEVAKTGCARGNAFVWTSTACDTGKYYTPRGQGFEFLMQCTLATDMKAVSCCGDVTVPPECDPCFPYSTKDCAQLGTDYKVDVSGRDDSLEVCGGSKYDDGSCFPAAATWQEAKDICQATGARLCTKDEAVGWETATSGCGLDNELIWTATECDAGKYYTPRGQGFEFLMECTLATDTKAVRCCGDVTLPTECTPPTRRLRSSRML